MTYKPLYKIEGNSWEQQTAVSRPATREDLPSIGEELIFEGHVKKSMPSTWHFNSVPTPKGINTISSMGYAPAGSKEGVLYLGVDDDYNAVKVDIIQAECKKKGRDNLPDEYTYIGVVKEYLDYEQYYRFVCSH